ncbi:MAG: 50S ribosomal protein L35 [Thermoleophilia bacterium]|jgi:large subunit ribosomal protein L35
MPKMKTHSASKKRFRLTSTGKLMRRKAFRTHLLERKTSKRKRGFRKYDLVAPGDAKNVKRLLGLK